MVLTCQPRCAGLQHKWTAVLRCAAEICAEQLAPAEASRLAGIPERLARYGCIFRCATAPKASLCICRYPDRH